MSHSAERMEKDCLNCGALVHGRYCHVCGQENVEPKESLWHMVTHFFYDITHFDSSFFITVKDLLFKPGFLSREYVLGRRKKYLHPVRMYVFTSAVFFLIFFALFQVPGDSVAGDRNEKLVQGLETVKSEALKNAKTKEDTAEIMRGFALIGLDSVTKDTSAPEPPGTVGGVKFTLGRDIDNYMTVHEYDSLQNNLPVDKRDKGLTRAITRKYVALNEKYEGDQRTITAQLLNKLLHTFPYLLFVSLPLYALFLRLLYIRHRRQYYFADHGVFLIHLYIFTFLFLLAYFGLDALQDVTQWNGIGWIQALLIFTGIFYTLKAMKNFYRQRWGKTILKFVLFNILCVASLGLLFSAFLLFSFYQI